MTQILIGCDPEVFVKQNGEFKSAYNLIKGDKKNPFKVRNGAVQVDGMALEFNINPASSADEFVHYVQDVFDQMKAMVPGYEVVATPVAKFSPEYMALQPKEALELGCDPDYNAYTMRANERPNGDRPMRTASGHVHIGWTNGMDVNDPDHIRDCGIIARQMDLFLGVGSLLYDKDVERRSMYGKAGCFRPKPYGVEYRTLSNAWLTSPELMKWVYRNAVAGVQRVFKEGRELYGDFQGTIDRNDVNDAEYYLNYYKIPAPPNV
jgi:hypothetical protein